MREPDDDAGRFYDLYGASLYRYAVMVLADHAAAEDVVQQVFVAVVRRLAGVDDIERYLWRAVRNACFSTLRARRSALVVAGGNRPLLEDMPGAPPVDPDTRLALEAAIRELPPDQRETIHMHVFEGRTFREIAEMTGDPQNTVASRYRYAVDKLRTVLAVKTP